MTHHIYILSSRCHDCESYPSCLTLQEYHYTLQEGYYCEDAGFQTFTTTILSSCASNCYQAGGKLLSLSGSDCRCYNTACSQLQPSSGGMYGDIYPGQVSPFQKTRIMFLRVIYVLWVYTVCIVYVSVLLHRSLRHT